MYEILAKPVNQAGLYKFSMVLKRVICNLCYRLLTDSGGAHWINPSCIDCNTVMYFTIISESSIFLVFGNFLYDELGFGFRALESTDDMGCTFVNSKVDIQYTPCTCACLWFGLTPIQPAFPLCFLQRNARTFCCIQFHNTKRTCVGRADRSCQMWT